MTVDGLINVDGINSRGVVQSGAGSGGSVIIDAGELRGHGSITCNGGNGNRVHHYHNRYISKFIYIYVSKYVSFLRHQYLTSLIAPSNL